MLEFDLPQILIFVVKINWQQLSKGMVFFDLLKHVLGPKITSDIF